MPRPLAFIGLLERRRRALTWLLPLAIALLAWLAGTAPAQAQPVSAHTRAKMARDFDGEMVAARVPLPQFDTLGALVGEP
jgi:hypothetical protein